MSLEDNGARKRGVLGTLAGTLVVLVGWLFYMSNGFFSSTLFLAGVIMVPTGLVIVGWAVLPAGQRVSGNG